MLHNKIKDHSVSGEFFELIRNLEFGYLQTHPRPDEKKLYKYYDSEEYISHTDNKRNAFEKVYHLVRKYALGQKLKLVNHHINNERKILDYGCGTGDFLETAKNNNWNVCGIEPDEKARQIANEKNQDNVLSLEEFDTIENNNFGVITLWHVLEHVPDLEEKISRFHNLLKSDGTLIIAVPNYKSYDALHYKAFWAAFDVPRHLWHFDKVSIEKLMAKHNFKLQKVKPMWFDAFYVSLLSEKYKTGAMGIIKASIIGLISNTKALFTKEASSHIYVFKKI